LLINGERLGFRESGWMEFGAEIDEQRLRLLVGNQADHGFILRVIQKFAEFLKAVSLPVELRSFVLHPLRKIVYRDAILQFEAMIFKNVTQERQRFFG